MRMIKSHKRMHQFANLIAELTNDRLVFPMRIDDFIKSGKSEEVIFSQFITNNLHKKFKYNTVGEVVFAQKGQGPK